MFVLAISNDPFTSAPAVRSAQIAAIPPDYGRTCQTDPKWLVAVEAVSLDVHGRTP